jgi:multicomponent Na+:H+ antiporter subunit E
MARVSLFWLLSLSLVWWVLATPRADAWVAAALAIGLGGLLHTGLGGRSGARFSPTGLLAFIPFFLLQSLEGGVDVARRAFAPSLPVAPGFMRYRVRLGPEPARIFFLNVISLLPGTFSARLDGEELLIHLLAGDPGAEARLSRVEDRVARLFGLPVLQ